MQLAPWINPPDPIAAARAGASLGLEKRGQDIQQREAVSRLLASQADSATQNSQFQQQMALRQQQVQAADALRQQQQDMLNRYRNAEIQKMNQQADAMKAAAQLKSDINDQTSAFQTAVSEGNSPEDALADYPLASHDPAVRSLLTQSAISKRAQDKESSKQTAADAVQSDTAGFLTDVSKGTSATDALAAHPLASRDPSVKSAVTQSYITQRKGAGGTAVEPIDQLELKRLQTEMSHDRSAESAAIAGEGKGDPKEWRKQYEAHKSEYDEILKKYRKPAAPVTGHDEDQDVDPAGINQYLNK